MAARLRSVASARRDDPVPVTGVLGVRLHRSARGGCSPVGVDEDGVEGVGGSPATPPMCFIRGLRVRALQCGASRRLRLSIVGRSSGATSLGEAPRPGLPGSGREYLEFSHGALRLVAQFPGVGRPQSPLGKRLLQRDQLGREARAG